MKSNLLRLVNTNPINLWRLQLLSAFVQTAEGEGGDLSVYRGFYTIERSQNILIFMVSRLCAHQAQNSWLIHRPKLVSDSVLESKSFNLSPNIAYSVAMAS